MDARRMLLRPRVVVFQQKTMVITAEKIRLTVMPVSRSGVITLTITAQVPVPTSSHACDVYFNVRVKYML
jgi:hypothetical protein